MSVPNQLATITARRGTYPTPLGTHHATFLIEVALATGAQLLRKDAGSHVALPSGVNVSQDILVFANGAECYDILSDGEGAAVPSWQPKGAIAGEYIDVAGFVTPTPSDPPPNSGPNLSDVLQRLAALEDRVAKIEVGAVVSPVTASTPPAGLAEDVKRIRTLLELVAKRFGLQ